MDVAVLVFRLLASILPFTIGAAAFDEMISNLDDKDIAVPNLIVFLLSVISLVAVWR